MKTPWTKSLAQRVLWGYYIFLGIVLFAAVLQWIDLSKLEWRMTMHDATENLLEAVLDLRRFEKNWFLYGKHSDYILNLSTVSKIEWLVSENKKNFSSLPNGKYYLPVIIETIYEYQNLMQKLIKTKDPEKKKLLENQVRQHGHRLGILVHSFRQDEKFAIAKTLRIITSSTIIFGIFVLFLVLIIEDQLAMSVVKPLREIIVCTQKIADGHFEECDVRHRDEEIRAIHVALRSMINKIKEREKEVIQSKKLAALGTLIAGVAHELNNPLSNIVTSAEILKEEFQEEEEIEREFCHEMLAQILDQAERAKRTVKSLLEYSRGKEMLFESVKLSDLLEETGNLVLDKITPGINFVIEIENDGTLVVDRQRIQQALINLINNAIQALAGSGNIVLYGTVDQRSRICEIKVKDDGPGIPAELQDKIFDPFFSTKDVGEGSGLGLFITHEIVTKHHGHIHVMSDSGYGAVFVITLPIKPLEVKTGKGARS